MKYFEKWANLAIENSHFKLISVILTSLVIVLSLSLILLALRKPLLIERGTALSLKADKNEITEDELESFIKEFISVKYNFDLENIEDHLRQSLLYTSSDLKTELYKNIGKEVSFSKNMKLSQALYPKDFKWEPYKGKKDMAAVEVLCDKILSMNGNRVLSSFKLSFLIEKNRRNSLNPTGLSITFIKETLPQN